MRPPKSEISGEDIASEGRNGTLGLGDRALPRVSACAWGLRERL